MQREVFPHLALHPDPSKSPWLNPIEPKWMHGKKAIAEPERVLTGQEVETRVCEYYG